MTPEQRRKNRRTALILVIFVIAVIVWAFWRASTGMG
ncbi:MAG TPA: cytochrome oxidase small assembly protein [Burkholderiaceae bacterium]|nr:cytochrome oxidase small assembly protein [Burkholderiaceae bacterium]